jgi:hypothetical protein
MGSDTALSLAEAATPNGSELAQVGAAASAQHEIQSAIIIARKFPRNEAVVFQKLMLACARPSFAEDARYSFPRGETDVTGPSVNLAREAARVWGNIRYGLYVVRDDDETRLIRGWAWDVETNTKVEMEDDFKKLIQRKVKGKPGETVWLVPDERDLRELTNRRGAILLRNCLLQVMPKDLVEDALFTCGKTLEQAAGANPDGERKRLLVDFGAMNISVEQIEQKLGHPFAQCSPKEIAELRGICKSIQDGHTTWAEYVKGPEKPAEKSAESKANEEALAKGQEALKQQQEQPKQEETEKKKAPMTCQEACFKLEGAQNVKEVAEVMNEALGDHLTSEERSKVLAHKDLAMKRLNPKKK